MPKTVACPHCGRPVVWGEESPYRPFCCERCRLIDLGDWLDERHRITDPSDAPSDDPPPASDANPPH
ncbi:MAG: DNA gyrase inhibitor YacG [Bdellovibrio bacteriovorus]